MFWRWSGRFPSLAELERDEFYGEPFWCVTREAGLLAADAPESVMLMARWMVPNKLMYREVV